MDLAHHKNRVRSKNSDSLLQGEEILAAFLLLPLGAMRHRTLSTAIGQIAGAATGAAVGASAGNTVDHSLETTLEEAFDAAEKRNKAQPHATATLFPDGNILFVITDRRYLIFRPKQGSFWTRYSFTAALPLSAITDVRLTLGLVANKVRLTFADGTSVLRDLPYGQGKHRNMIKAFSRVRGQAFPPQTPPARQVIEEQADRATSPKSPAPAVNAHPESPLPSALRTIPYAIGRVLVPVGAGMVTLILLLLLIVLHLYHPDTSGGGSSPAPAPAPAWVSRANDYCRTVIVPALKKSGILTATTPADYAQAVPAAEGIDYRMSRYLLSVSVHGSAQLALLSMSIDWIQIAKYESAAAYASNSAGFNNAVNTANSLAMVDNQTANRLGLHDCARASRL